MHGKLKIDNQRTKIENRYAGFTPLENSGVVAGSLFPRIFREIPKRVSISGKKQRFLTGFTLVEVVMASALLIIVIVPILKALTVAQVTGNIIERRTRSLTLAQAKLDEIKARSVYNYSDDFDQDDLFLDGQYLCNVQDAASGSDLRTITVSVGFDLDGDNDLSAGEIEVTLTTLVAKRM